jgi:nucleotide-binding universal stress UspA family protein
MLRPPPPIERILAPTDFGAPSLVATQYAARLALDLGVWLTLLHVLPEPNEMIGIVPGATTREELATLRAHAETRMAAVEADVRALGLARVITVIDDAPSVARAILAHSASGRIDLIVMATHGRHGLPRAVLGSVADHVIRSAHCPVLTMRPE